MATNDEIILEISNNPPGVNSAPYVVTTLGDVVETNPPKVLEVNDGTVSGIPTTPSLARGVVSNTTLTKNNNRRSHVCDITPQVRAVTSWIKVKYGQIVNFIREKIRALLKALGYDPSGQSSALVSLLKKIRNYILDIVRILADVQAWRDAVIDVAAKAKAMIDYILSLPEKLFKFLSDCLGGLTTALAAGFQELASLGTTGGSGDLRQAVKDLNDAAGTLLKQTQDLINTPNQLANVLTSPSDPNSIKEIESYISSITPSASSILASAGFDKTQTQSA